MALFQKRESSESLADLLVHLGRKSLYEATRFVQEMVTDATAWGPDQVAEHQRILEEAQAGAPDAVAEAKDLVYRILKQYAVEIEDMTREEAAYRIYAYAWGLDVLEDLYHDPEVDEIRVDRPDKVTIQRRGRNEDVPVKFKDEEHVKKIVSRLFIHDRGVALTASTPAAESIRKDGTRVTATCPPVTQTWTFVLRKHDTFEMTPDNLIRAGTLNGELLDLLALLVRGRANIMISGGIGSGKTSLLRFLLKYLPERLRVVTLENDRELRLSEHYPERSVVEMEEHPEMGYNMERLFRTVLRYTADVIIVGEVRGRGEATEAVKACTRGHDGSMVTIHFSSPEEAVGGYGKMMLEEGLNLPIDIAVTWVTQAFDVIVQMFADTTKGIKKIIQVTEICVEGSQIEYRDLALWQPHSEDFFDGKWVFPNLPSPKLAHKMNRYGVPSAEIKKLRHAEKAVALA